MRHYLWFLKTAWGFWAGYPVPVRLLRTIRMAHKAERLRIEDERARL